MKRLVICIAIFAAMIVMATSSVFILRSLNLRLADTVSQAVTLAESGNTGLAAAKVREIEDCWEKYYKRASFLVQKSKLEDISYAVFRLCPLLEGNSEEFFSECEMIVYSTRQLFENELPRLSSVL